MKKIISVIYLVLGIVLISGCQKSTTNDINTTTNNKKEVIEEKTVEEFNNIITITINDRIFKATLVDNETSRELIKRLPLELTMNDLNENEKYIYLDNSFPTQTLSPKQVQAGDIMLYGDNCLVIFYKSFDTSYSYTKIGHIDNLPDLGKDEIAVKFEK